MRKNKKKNDPMTFLVQLLQKKDIAAMANAVEDRLQDYVQWVQPYEGEGGYPEGMGDRLGEAVEFLNQLENLQTLLQTVSISNHQDDGCFAVIRWQEEDIKQALANQGYRANKANVKRVLDSRLGKTLVDRSIEEGWVIIEDCLGFVDGLEWRKSRRS